MQNIRLGYPTHNKVHLIRKQPLMSNFSNDLKKFQDDLDKQAQEMIANNLVAKFPNARFEKHNFRFTKFGSQIRIDPNSLSESLKKELRDQGEFS